MISLLENLFSTVSGSWPDDNRFEFPVLSVVDVSSVPSTAHTGADVQATNANFSHFADYSSTTCCDFPVGAACANEQLISVC
jgi:hypothetical protein